MAAGEVYVRYANDGREELTRTQKRRKLSQQYNRKCVAEGSQENEFRCPLILSYCKQSGNSHGDPKNML